MVIPELTLVLGNGDSATSLTMLPMVVTFNKMAPPSGVLGGSPPSLGANNSKLRLAMVLGVSLDSTIVDITNVCVGHMSLNPFDESNGPFGPRLLSGGISVLVGAQLSELVGTFITKPLSLCETPISGLLLTPVHLDSDHVPDPVGPGFKPVP